MAADPIIIRSLYKKSNAWFFIIPIQSRIIPTKRTCHNTQKRFSFLICRRKTIMATIPRTNKIKYGHAFCGLEIPTYNKKTPR